MAIEFSLLPNTPKAPLIPDIETIMKFASGNIGVCETYQKKSIADNLSKSKSKKSIDTFLKNSNSSVTPGKTNKNIKLDDISVTDTGNGQISLEKTIVTSSFESLKPYVSIGLLLTQSMADMEDLIARLLGITAPSLRPVDNPKSLSYKLLNAKEDMTKINSLSQTTTSSKGGFPSAADQKTVSDKLSNQPKLSLDPNLTGYKVLSIEYSTGIKLQNYKYDYTYKIIENEKLNLKGVDKPTIKEPDNRPKTVVFGIYNKNGKPIEAPNWLINSKKWFGQFNNFTSM